ncbi:tyrosinase family protein [Saprospiraceae bacterium]|nr:tyrosinase family protein [Saprospiraceae bacterium]
MKTRKNINCLSTNELHDLREAFTGIFNLPATNANSFANIAGLHGSPGTSHCPHGGTGFLSWHRAYLLELEEALSSIHCGVSLPFWDWSTRDTIGIPNACKNATYTNRLGNSVANPLYAGPVYSGGMTSRSSSVNTRDFSTQSQMARLSLTRTTWSQFNNELENAHNGIHGGTGGNMGSVATAAYDPIFWLHHCNIDRLWARWQVLNPGNMASSEANFSVNPFFQPYSTNLYEGRDFEHIGDWNYRYRSFCFIRPWRDWFEIETFVMKKVHFTSNPIEPIIDFEAPHMPMQSSEIKVFIQSVEDGKKPKTKDAYVGSFYLFGMGEKMELGNKKDEPYRLSLALSDKIKEHIDSPGDSIAIKFVTNAKEDGEMVKKYYSNSSIEVRDL